MSVNPDRSSRRLRAAELVVVCSLVLAAGLIGCDGVPAGGAGASHAVSDPAVTLYGDEIPANASLREILRHPDLLERSRHVAYVLQRADPEQLDDLRADFDSAALFPGDFEYALFVNWWARFDPEAAFRFADHRLRFEHPRVLQEVVRSWAKKDPIGLYESGFIHTTEVNRPALEGYLVDALVVGWFESGEPGLEDFVLGELATDASAFASAVKAWIRMLVMRDGEVATLEWAMNAPYHADVRRLLLAGALTVIAHQNPVLCVEWFDRLKAAGVDVGSFVARISNAWGHHDPKSALAWVLTFPVEDRERSRSINHVADRWIKRDQAGLEEWLETRIGDKTTDSIRYRAIRRLVKQEDWRVDWAHLESRASHIVDPGRRTGLMLWLLQRWNIADPAGAQAWSDAHPDTFSDKLWTRASLVPDKDRVDIEAALGLEPSA